MKKKVAIIDYELGNLFSVLQACRYVGLEGFITNDRTEINNADAIILPGVGAFGAAMEKLNKLELVEDLKDFSASDKPFLGICLGMQLLFSRSEEFGNHKGLDIIQGEIKKFSSSSNTIIKIPQVQWNTIDEIKENQWGNTILHGIPPSTFMYFVHSYYCKPNDPDKTLCTTTYGKEKYSSIVQQNNTIGIQFHPEKSGPYGLSIYENFSKMILNQN